MSTYYTQAKIAEHVQDFKERAKNEPGYCQELFRYATVRLMAHKYGYYVASDPLVSDATYDVEEKGWYCMGLALGLLKDDETSPCVGFDDTHAMAKAGQELYESMR